MCSFGSAQKLLVALWSAFPQRDAIDEMRLLSHVI